MSKCSFKNCKNNTFKKLKVDGVSYLRHQNPNNHFKQNKSFKKIIMQLLHERTTLPLSTIMKNSASGNFEIKEKKSSDASLLLMNPVASGDNVTIRRNSSYKLKEEMPQLIPCCEGRELQISEDLVRTGLSAISVKHDGVLQCVSLSRATDYLQRPQEAVKHRNSFRCLHRPDLKRVPLLRRMTPEELEALFRGYADVPQHGNAKNNTNHDREKSPRRVLPPDENLRNRDLRETNIQGSANALHPIPETRSGVEDVPAGMRLHGARARLYTSVLAGARAGDQLDNVSTNEEYVQRNTDDSLPEDEVQLNEELQIILPPRPDDVTAESSKTTTSTYDSQN